MSQDAAIMVRNVSKRYLLYRQPQDRLKQYFFYRFGKNYASDFWALRDVSFEVPRGETLGVIGQNGSGKSTLLQIIAGTLRPTAGEVRTRGPVAALLELGTGFNPEFSGRENVFLNGAILGFSEKEMRRRFDAIADFAEIGEFMDQPVKTYSSGMYVRLAFAIAVCVDPAILIIDEALAVGDAYFQQRCMRKMREFKRDGKAIVLVTHDPSIVKNLCDRALWLKQGQLYDLGTPDRIVQRYLAFVFGQSERKAAEPEATPKGIQASVSADVSHLSESGESWGLETVVPNIGTRFGDGRAEIIGFGAYDEKNERAASLVQSHAAQIRVSVRFRARVSRPIVGYVIRNRLGVDLASTNTDLEGFALPTGEPGTAYTVRFRIDLPMLQPGPYSFAASVADGDYVNYTICDWIEDIFALQVIGEQFVSTEMRFPTQCYIETDGKRGAWNGH